MCVCVCVNAFQTIYKITVRCLLFADFFSLCVCVYVRRAILAAVSNVKRILSISKCSKMFTLARCLSAPRCEHVCMYVRAALLFPFCLPIYDLFASTTK